MARSYSILILPQRGTQIRRFLLTPRLLCGLFGGGAALLGLCGWVLSDYLSVRVQLNGARTQLEDFSPVEAELQYQRERLGTLGHMAGNIQDLLTDWKGLQKKIRTSLPAKHRASVNGQGPFEELEKSLVGLRGELERLIASVPNAWPTKGHVSSGIGMRKDPWTKQPGFHAGLDIPKPTGTPIHAPGAGVVEVAGRSNGNGNTVILNHGQGITTLYAHLSKIHVTEGQQVKKGQLIAAVGNTGKSTSPHLHYEVRVNGIPVDPRRNLIRENSPSS
jgi:murein DD-endopeptidase MepM/ murein hydrolase activator NlpD